MRRNSCFMVVGAAAAAASCVVAGPAQAASVNATPSISAVVHGLSVDYSFALLGTQHSALAHDKSGKVVTVSDPGMLSVDVHFGDGQGTGGNGGNVACQSTGVAPLKSAMPYSYTYEKPGTYKVTANFSYCGDASNSQVSKTIYVTVGKSAPVVKPSAPVKPVASVTPSAPVAPSHVAPAVPSNPPVAAPSTHPSVPSTAMGPKVQTDGAASSNDSDLMAAGGGLVALMAGGVVARRRMAQSK